MNNCFIERSPTYICLTDFDIFYPHLASLPTTQKEEIIIWAENLVDNLIGFSDKLACNSCSQETLFPRKIDCCKTYYKGGYDASTGSLPHIYSAYEYVRVDVAGNVNGVSLYIGQYLLLLRNNPYDITHFKISMIPFDSCYCSVPRDIQRATKELIKLVIESRGITNTGATILPNSIMNCLNLSAGDSVSVGDIRFTRGNEDATNTPSNGITSLRIWLSKSDIGKQILSTLDRYSNFTISL